MPGEPLQTDNRQISQGARGENADLSRDPDRGTDQAANQQPSEPERQAETDPPSRGRGDSDGDQGQNEPSRPAPSEQHSQPDSQSEDGGSGGAANAASSAATGGGMTMTVEAPDQPGWIEARTPEAWDAAMNRAGAGSTYTITTEAEGSAGGETVMGAQSNHDSGSTVSGGPMSWWSSRDGDDDDGGSSLSSWMSGQLQASLDRFHIGIDREDDDGDSSGWSWTSSGGINLDSAAGFEAASDALHDARESLLGRTGDFGGRDDDENGFGMSDLVADEQDDDPDDSFFAEVLDLGGASSQFDGFAAGDSFGSAGVFHGLNDVHDDHGMGL